MEINKYLNEERYQKSKQKISRVALIILIVGLLIGSSLIATGIIKQSKVNSNYSSESKANLQKELDAEKVSLESKKAELETKRTVALNAEKKKLESKKNELTSKGIKYDLFAKYDEGEKYDLKIITKVLDPSFDNCAFDEYKDNVLTSLYCLISNKKDENSKGIAIINNALDTRFNYCSFDETKNNSYTSKYCSLKDQLNNLTDGFYKSYESSKSIPFYMFGAFFIIASCMFAGAIFMFTKRREILAFQAQQVMPVAKEGLEGMAPTIGKVGKTIVKDMAPAYGEVAKEISKGIKEGLKGEDNKE